VDATHQSPTVARLRMRIAETRIKQHRVAAKLDISDGQLSHILAGRKRVDDIALLVRIAEAIEQVAAEAAA
jgi:transcriptional regulator with XRE-family HTH domain